MSVSQYPTYIKFPSEIADRLSYGDNHPEREALFVKLNSAKREGFDLKRLDSIVELIEDKVEPSKNYAEQVITYLGLEGIESNTGKATYKKCLGKEIRSTSKRFTYGNIVFAGLRPYLNKAHLVQDIKDALGSSELFVIEPDNNQVIPEFLLTYLLSDLVLNQTKWILTGSSYPRLDESDFRKLLVILPKDKDVQTSILATIKPLTDDAERMRNNLSELMDACRNVIIKKLKVSLPKPTKFVTSNPSIFVSSPADNPERLDLIYHHPWMNKIRQLLATLTTVKLEALIEPQIDYGVTASGKDNGEIPFLNIENISPDGRIEIANVKYIDACKGEGLVHKDDILISRSRLVGICGLVSDREDGFSFGSYILRMKVRKNSKIPAEYIVGFLNSDLGQAQIRLLETGSFGKNINTRQLKDIDIVVPFKESDISNSVVLIKEKWDEINKMKNLTDLAWISPRNKFTDLLLGI